MTRKKKVVIWSSSSLGLGLLLWLFRNALLSFAESVIVWNFPWNFLVPAISLIGYLMRKPIRNRTRHLISVLPQKWGPVVLMLVLVVFLAVSFLVTSTIFEASNQPSIGKAEEKKSDQPAQTIPASRKVLGWIIVLAVICVFAYNAKARWETGKKIYEQKFLRGPVGITTYVILGTYLVIAFLLPNFWSLIWNDQIFFWSLTIGIVVLVFLRTMTGSDGKPLSYAKKGSVVFGAIWLLGLFAQMSRNPYWQGIEVGIDAPSISNRKQTNKNNQIIVEAPIDRLSDIQRLDPSRGPVNFFGGGKKYTVRWNGTVDEDLPREPGAAPKTPPVTEFFQVRSREKEPIKIFVVVGGS